MTSSGLLKTFHDAEMYIEKLKAECNPLRVLNSESVEIHSKQDLSTSNRVNFQTRKLFLCEMFDSRLMDQKRATVNLLAEVKPSPASG